jgi:hypothetical protein
VTVVMGWDLNWFFRFTKLIEKHRPKLVIIDSITGCSRGSAFDENKKEFASPIYWLANNNGRLFPACTILLIHHANKTGGFRGSTAIRDAVDEVWGLRRPDKGQQERGLHNARLITVEKSRAGRDGSKLLMKLEDDLTFSLTDYVELDQESNNPASIVDKVLQRIRVVHPRDLTLTDLAADPLCGGTVAGISKALQRLSSRGLIQEGPKRAVDRRFMKTYFAVLSRDMCVNSCPVSQKPSEELEKLGGQALELSSGVQGVSSEPEQTGHSLDNPPPCPPNLPSDAKGSALTGQVVGYSPREKRTPEELGRLMKEAASLWE